MELEENPVWKDLPPGAAAIFQSHKKRAGSCGRIKAVAPCWFFQKILYWIISLRSAHILRSRDQSSLRDRYRFSSWSPV